MGKKLLYILLSSFVFCLTKSLWAQKENNIWYFADSAGLDFNSGAPVPLSDGMLASPWVIVNGSYAAHESSSSICDAAGNLLFYTDGINVWTKNHTLMPNGTGLLGDVSSTQGSLIIKVPGSASRYYIFTLPIKGSMIGLRYTEVDMSLGSLGEVVSTNKNIRLYGPTCEKMAAIKHCNNEDIWVITHEWNSNGFRAYLFTSAGVDPTPVISNVGLVIKGDITSIIGQMKASRDGKRLAVAVADTADYDQCEVYEFDNFTGKVFNPITLPKIKSKERGPYGIEFSPDGKILYSAGDFPAQVFQYNLCAGSKEKVQASKKKIGSSSGHAGALLLGPDDKIYLNIFGSKKLSVISNPNALGPACGFIPDALFLPGIKRTRMGLPTLFAPWLTSVNPITPPFNYAANCMDASFQPPEISTKEETVCAKGTSDFDISYEWNFGDSAYAIKDNISYLPNPTHTYTEEGTYKVRLVVQYRCNLDTLYEDVTVKDCNIFLYAPNSFTPNRDEVNDVFTIPAGGIAEAQLFIFDRWGKLIFDAGKQYFPENTLPWNGRYKNTGDLLPQGVYVWRLKYTTLLGEKKEKIGHITLLR